MARVSDYFYLSSKESKSKKKKCFLFEGVKVWQDWASVSELFYKESKSKKKKKERKSFLFLLFFLVWGGGRGRGGCKGGGKRGASK